MITRGKPSKGAGINSPTVNSRDHASYHRECVFAVEPSIIRLIEMAADAGWTKPDVIVAIISAAAGHLESPNASLQAEGRTQALSGASDGLH
jgi:hypothetical protein